MWRLFPALFQPGTVLGFTLVSPRSAWPGCWCCPEGAAVGWGLLSPLHIPLQPLEPWEAFPALSASSADEVPEPTKGFRQLSRVHNSQITSSPLPPPELFIPLLSHSRRSEGSSRSAPKAPFEPRPGVSCVPLSVSHSRCWAPRSAAGIPSQLPGLCISREWGAFPAAFAVGPLEEVPEVPSVAPGADYSPFPWLLGAILPTNVPFSLLC